MTLTDAIASIAEWLIDGARSARTPDAVLTELCERVVAAGIPIWRAAIFIRTLHPEIMGRRIEWREGHGTAISEASYAVFDSTAFRGSPVARVYDDARPLRLRLALEPMDDAFPQLNELRAEGATDYLAVPFIFGNGEVHVGVWSTRAVGGFTDSQLAALKSLTGPLSRLAEIHALRRTATNLLNTYVGNEAGARILAGQIRRGFTETIRAVIWLSDMRGFTALADRMEPTGLIALLNRYFECQVPAIQRHGGEILKFMGDGLLAIFPLNESTDPGHVCQRALTAAIETRAAIAALGEWPAVAGIRWPRFGVALHIGELLYGNIGAGNRLDFTCIGPAVNLAARLEGLASRLGRTTLLSADFAEHCPDEVIPLGAFTLAGFRQRMTVYGLADESSREAG
ncbi:MAG TPA: adenylate/guanylate cyclase domain-containing protein [Stellaceae bacterium]|nr:adenylate/guanylate cyclase domain-containing protein [Stellaceae bacterium]